MELSQENLLLSLILYRRRKTRELKNTKRFWARKIFAQRKEKGECNNLVQEMRIHDHEFLFKMFLMSPSQLEDLTKPVAPLLTKESVHREAIPRQE